MLPAEYPLHVTPELVTLVTEVLRLRAEGKLPSPDRGVRYHRMVEGRLCSWSADDEARRARLRRIGRGETGRVV